MQSYEGQNIILSFELGEPNFYTSSLVLKCFM